MSKAIWVKGYDEVTIGELYRLNEKYEFLCNGDRKNAIVYIKDEYYKEFLKRRKKYEKNKSDDDEKFNHWKYGTITKKI